MFRSREVSGANAVQVLTISALFAFQILVALYLQIVRGYAPPRLASRYSRPRSPSAPSRSRCPPG
ncbi:MULTISPECIES: hypothetical protein [unclassified Kitasatospora]|uniref:hypothetical protein n=1 Tax=unclassified Kitasatospora TaxID=2633591 RepID=UPI003809CA04